MRELVPDLMVLFDGYRRSYGTYSPVLNDQGGGKMKGVASTVRGDVTLELWMRHLSGEVGLGIIPIDEHNMVKFAAIDIDEYPLDLLKLNANIQKNELPLVLCRTKSGGAHLYLFLETSSDAAVVQGRMREMAATLGYGNAEIFPKQTRIVAARGDMGSWINMPYFNIGKTDRYALNAEGKVMGFAEFMQYAMLKRISFETLRKVATVGEDPLPGGPPCLNHLASMGFPQGSRNNGLFSMAVYCRKAFGDDWAIQLREMNAKYMTPPLDESEVEGIIKSASKKEFNYPCKQAPICNYCNMPKCRNTKFGIGMGDLGMPTFGSLTKLMTDPPVWFLQVEGGGRLELTTSELQNPREFQQRCMAVLNVMPISPKAADWQEIIHKLLTDVTEITVPEEATPRGQLWQHLQDFVTSRVSARIKEEMLLGKPFLENGMYYFRMKDFMAYLERQRFKMPVHHIQVYFNDWKVKPRFWNLKGKGCNTLMIPQEDFERQTDSFDTPVAVDPQKILT